MNEKERGEASQRKINASIIPRGCQVRPSVPGGVCEAVWRLYTQRGCSPGRVLNICTDGTHYLTCGSAQGRVEHDDLVCYFYECAQAYSYMSLDLLLYTSTVDFTLTD